MLGVSKLVQRCDNEQASEAGEFGMMQATDLHYSLPVLNGQEVELYINALFVNNAKIFAIEFSWIHE